VWLSKEFIMADRSREQANMAASKEGLQPDPMLMTTRRVHPAWMSLLGIIIILVLAVVFYGLNEPVTSEETASSAAPAASSTSPSPQAPTPSPSKPAPAKNSSG
jgi:hypothetical protein